MNYYTPADIFRDPNIRRSIAIQYCAAQSGYAQYFRNQPELRLDKFTLFEAIGSCYCDLYRLKAFRGIQQEDKHKLAAFLIKWITKTQPIQINSGLGDTKKQKSGVNILLANELFATLTALTLLDISPEQFFTDERIKTYCTNFVYLLKFHSSTPERIASELFLLERYLKEGLPST
jgi:hypothetical protein